MKTQALAFVSRDEISAEVATGHEIAELVSAGVKVEQISGTGNRDLFEVTVPAEPLPALDPIEPSPSFAVIYDEYRLKPVSPTAVLHEPEVSRPIDWSKKNPFEPEDTDLVDIEGPF